jgi:hypothetical protein
LSSQDFRFRCLGFRAKRAHIQPLAALPPIETGDWGVRNSSVKFLRTFSLEISSSPTAILATVRTVAHDDRANWSRNLLAEIDLRPAFENFIAPQQLPPHKTQTSLTKPKPGKRTPPLASWLDMISRAPPPVGVQGAHRRKQQQGARTFTRKTPPPKVVGRKFRGLPRGSFRIGTTQDTRGQSLWDPFRGPLSRFSFPCTSWPTRHEHA